MDIHLTPTRAFNDQLFSQELEFIRGKGNSYYLVDSSMKIEFLEGKITASILSKKGDVMFKSVADTKGMNTFYFGNILIGVEAPVDEKDTPV